MAHMELRFTNGTYGITFHKFTNGTYGITFHKFTNGTYGNTFHKEKINSQEKKNKVQISRHLNCLQKWPSTAFTFRFVLIDV